MNTLLLFTSSTGTGNLTANLNCKFTACVILQHEASGAFLSYNVESDPLDIVSLLNEGLAWVDEVPG